ncbi:hypothetical protein D3C85_1579380 [compost metagenome]
MANYGGLDVVLWQSEAGVAWAACRLKQGSTQAGHLLPVRGERVDVALGDTSVEVRINILQVFRLATVDVTWQVEVEVILRVGNLVKRHHAGIARGIDLPREGVHDLVDVLLA